MFQFGDNGEQHSIVAKAVFGLSNGHDLIEATDYDRRLASELGTAPKPNECVLRSSSEEHWVAHFASLCLDRFRSKCPKIAFHTFCEIPSKKSEKLKAAGYDLSLGPFDTTLRLRTMHKTTPLAWCDRPWTVPFSGDDIGHLKSLAEGQHPFFVVIHAFYCIHDWRRMGVTANADKHNRLDTPVVLPPVNSIARTIIFELSNIRDFISDNDIKKWKFVREAAKSTGKTDSEKLASLISRDLYHIQVNGETLKDEDGIVRPTTLDDFLNRIDQCWIDEWGDSEIGKQ